MRRSIDYFPDKQGYYDPKEKVRWTAYDYQNNCIHVTPRELGFTEQDTVTGAKILAAARRDGLGFLGGLCDSGWPLVTLWSQQNLKDRRLVYISAEPLVDTRGDAFIVCTTTAWTGFFPIKLDGKDVVFPLGSDWFFIKTPEYRLLKK